jgi:hypothetical protein
MAAYGAPAPPGTRSVGGGGGFGMSQQAQGMPTLGAAALPHKLQALLQASPGAACPVSSLCRSAPARPSPTHMHPIVSHGVLPM